MHTLDFVVDVRLFGNAAKSRRRNTLGGRLLVERMRRMGRKLARLHVGIAKIFLIYVVALFRCILTSIGRLLIFVILDFVILLLLD